MQTSALFGAKKIDKGVGIEPVQTFCGEGGKSMFRDFVRTSFMADPLTKSLPCYYIVDLEQPVHCTSYDSI